MKEYVGSPVLQTCVFSFLLHVYQRHVGVQKLLFFQNYQQPCVTQIPVSLPPLSLPLHTTKQSGCCGRQATYGFIQKH